MEEEGAPTTSAVRNLARRRKAAKEHEANPAQDFVDLFNCCGVDLGLGGGNKETYYDMTREMEKARYEEQLRKKQEREEMLRKSYKKKVVRESLVENVSALVSMRTIRCHVDLVLLILQLIFTSLSFSLR